MILLKHHAGKSGSLFSPRLHASPNFSAAQQKSDCRMSPSFTRIRPYATLNLAYSARSSGRQALAFSLYLMTVNTGLKMEPSPSGAAPGTKTGVQFHY